MVIKLCNTIPYESGKIPAALSNAIGLGFASLAKKKAQVELLASKWGEFMKGLETVVARINLFCSNNHPKILYSCNRLIDRNE